METVATVCGYCGVGCGMELHVVDGVVTKTTGSADHPANRGRLCTKGNCPGPIGQSKSWLRTSTTECLATINCRAFSPART
jgi:anaerobic selenocysteine-containing dehydrogenase